MVIKANSPLETETTSASKLLHLKLATAKPALEHLPLSSPRAYYRSKLITFTNGINPLLATANTLLAHINHLNNLTEPPAVLELYQSLVHEIKAFETHAQTQGYRSELILVARYILCTALDEAILSSPWGEQSNWTKHRLLVTFHGESWGGERFYLILERLSSDPALHLDVLELIYVCLSLGYRGKYQLNREDNSTLDTLIDNLYQLIRWQRGDLKKHLTINPINSTLAPVAKTAKEALPWWLLLSFSSAFLLLLYLGFNYLLGSSTTPLIQQLSNFTQLYG